MSLVWSLLSILKTIYWEQCWQVCSLFLLLYVMQSDSGHVVFKWTVYENPTYKELLFVWLGFFCSSMDGYKCIVYCNKYRSFHTVNTLIIFRLILWHLWFVGFLAWPCRLTVLWQKHWFRFFQFPFLFKMPMQQDRLSFLNEEIMVHL